MWRTNKTFDEFLQDYLNHVNDFRRRKEPRKGFFDQFIDLNIPDDFIQSLRGGGWPEEYSFEFDGPIDEGSIFVDRQQKLIQLAEINSNIAMRRYDMPGVRIQRHGEFLKIHKSELMRIEADCVFPGRSVVLTSVYGSQIIFCRVKQDDFGANGEFLLLQTNPRAIARLNTNNRFNLSLWLSRRKFNLYRTGVDRFEQNSWMANIIIPVRKQPEADFPQPYIELSPDFDLIDDRLDAHQKKAVINILSCSSRPAPYLLIGPPGTGKTTTLIEAILQIIRQKSNKKILFCHPGYENMKNIIHQMRGSNLVNDDEHLWLIAPHLQDYIEDDSSARVYTDEISENIRLVTSNILNSSLLSKLSFRLEFDYVFIDVAHWSFEAENSLVLSYMKPGGCCILSGDLNQLGLEWHIPIAERFGFGQSLIGRLKENHENYQRNEESGKYDDRFITELNKCYRSDARVQSFCNELFYNNQLTFSDVQTPQYVLDALDIDYPLVFHNIEPIDQPKDGDTFWFNTKEIEICVEYVRRLYAAETPLRPDQIAIITDFACQVQRLEARFLRADLEPCIIGKFQSSESEVVIISTVRTTEAAAEYSFGSTFFQNPKRFVSSVGRAKWLVIALGNSEILRRDHYWNAYHQRACRFRQNFEREI